MKTLKLLFAAIAAVCCSLVAEAAEKTAKAVVENDGKTLRFVYDETNYGTKGTDWFSVAEAEAIDPYWEYVPWCDCGETVTKVVFDSSFAAYRPKQCGSWFYDFGVLAAVDGLKNLNTSVTTNMAGIFYGCESLTSLDVTSFDTANVTDMEGMFCGCSSLTTLDVSGFDTANVLNMGYMFNGCSLLTSLDVSGFNTVNVTDMSWMFCGCESLTSLDVSGFDTANVTDMAYMFCDCSSLTTLDVSGFDTANVTAMAYMFSGCSSLTTLDVTGFDTANVKDMSGMFADCESLTSIDVTGFDTANVTGMGYMFTGCSSLTTLDVSGFDTANVTYMEAMFSGCSSLTTLDVSGFDTANVMDMAYMFSGCSSLEAICASDRFVTDRAVYSPSMFKNCTALVGGAGTVYDSAKTDREYARIDGKDGQPGYFTRGAAKIATGVYASLDLVKDLGIVIPEDVDYAAGDKVTVKVEGLAKGLKVVVTPVYEDPNAKKKVIANYVYTIEGVPTEPVDFEKQPMFARVTVTYKDKTKTADGTGKVETLQPIFLSITAPEPTVLTAGVLNQVYAPVDIATLWPEVADAEVNPKDWSFKGWPAGIKYNNKETDANWSYKEGGATVKTNAGPWTVYGQPTKAGVYPVTATWKHKLEDNKTTVSETFSAVLTVWGSEGEKDFRYTARAYGDPVDVTIADAKSVSGLPTGIKHDKETGKVTGTPTKPGDFVVTVTKKDDEKETFIWNVAPPDAPEFELDPGTAPVENLKVQIVQGANQAFAITATAGAKVTASGLPTGLKLVQDKTTGLYSVEGVATKPGEYVVTFKTVLNKVTTVTTTAFTVKGNPFTATYRGYLTARPADGAEKRLAIAEISVAAAGTVKLTYTEGKTKYTASVKSFDWNDTTGWGKVEGLVLKVSSADRQLGYGDRKATVAFNARDPVLYASLFLTDAEDTMLMPWAYDLYATVKTTEVKLPESQTFVFRTEDGADTNALATVSLAYDASKATAAFSGKLYDGTAVKATVPVLRWDDEGTPQEGTSDDYVFAPFLVIAKDGTVYRFERFSSAEDGGFICWVGEDGESGEEAGSANADFTPCDKRFAELVSETGSFAFGWGSDAETVGADAEEFAFEVTKDKEGKPKGVAIYDADSQSDEKPLTTVTAKIGKKTGAISVSFTSKKNDKAKYAVELVWRDDQFFAGHVMRTWKGVDPVANKPVNLSASGTAEVTAGAGDDYLVIDLSGGPDAASYPVSYLDAEPQGGWTDEYKTEKLVLRKIQPGTFTMGCETTEIGYMGYEAVPHPVTISRPFYMGVFQVTQRQWELVMGTKPSYFSNATYYKTRPVECVSWNMIRGDSSTYNWPNVKTVDPATFIGKLRAKAGLEGIDLPTEAQWEYACRAGTTTALNSGKNLTSEYNDANMNEVGRYKVNFPSGSTSYNSSSTTSEGTAAVGSYKPNDWGLYDMHGNVWERCLDWYTSTDPFDPASGSYRVIRGGGWHDAAECCRSATRIYDDPSSNGLDDGFRLCCSAGLQ